MTDVQISEDALEDLNYGFLFMLLQSEATGALLVMAHPGLSSPKCPNEHRSQKQTCQSEKYKLRSPDFLEHFV